MKKYTLNIVCLVLLIAATFWVIKQEQEKENLQNEISTLESEIFDLRQENDNLTLKVEELIQQQTLLQNPPLKNSFLTETDEANSTIVDDEKRLLMMRISNLEKQIGALRKKR